MIVGGSGERCARCWARGSALGPYAPEGMLPVTLCRACREDAPRDPVVFREIFMRFGSAKELISHYEARDEGEAIRKLCIERKLDYRTVARAIEEHGGNGGAQGFLAFTRPYGYDMRDGGLAVRPEEARTVGLIFEMYLGGKGIAKIAGELNRHKIHTKTGKDWASQTIANILSNPVYCGLARLNGGIKRGKHVPLIEIDTFNRVQNEMQRRIRRPDQRKADPPQLRLEDYRE